MSACVAGVSDGLSAALAGDGGCDGLREVCVMELSEDVESSDGKKLLCAILGT